MSRSALLISSVLALGLVAACGEPGPTEGSGRAQTKAAASANPLVQAIEAAAALPPEPPGSGAPDPALVRMQILLDRTPFSPGEIDGLDGSNLRRAIDAYRQTHGLSASETADDALLQALIRDDDRPVTTTLRLTEADVGGPFSPPPGDDLQAQARKGVGYTSALERLAERVHASPALLQALNPGVAFDRAGQTVVVPLVDRPPLAPVARVEIDGRANRLIAYGEDGVVLAVFPATVGSSDNPSPRGDLKVNGVARAPDYTYDPAKLSYGPGGKKVVVPAGPNNPVGAVWIDLSRESYGIHGTPEPSRIGKTASHGCVRLTNWDAQQLAAAVKPGVEVKFI